MNSKIGVLLLNLGTPRSYKVWNVAQYLREFLSDKRVIELPAILRWLLVNLFIVPFRAHKSAHAYSSIWQDQGSPLLVNSMQLKALLAKELGPQYSVSLGMTYGSLTIAEAIAELYMERVQKIIILPLFPQYSSAASGAPLEQALQILAKDKIIPDLNVIASYYQDPYFIQALALSIQPYLSMEHDYVLMSYHGLPERQNIGITPYSTQCYQTSRMLAQSLNLPNHKWGVSFQSRLGKLPWIKPYTDEVLVDLSKRGIKKILICCPSFAVDCLETLEEIGIRANEQWLSLGGESLQLVPCLNAQSFWIEAIVKMINRPS